jgi:uncharacterized lipoprotein YddW (UPF0748 family)
MRERFLVILALLFLQGGLWGAGADLGAIPPRVPREFRGAWVVTVGNIDWPSKPGLSSAQQQNELVAILDRAVQLRLNAVLLQVRPACDAFYQSTLEPWSEYLTGKMGQAPQPFYDPLRFAVEQAHRRGLELHAWFNPFRARLAGVRSPAASSHITRTKPHLARSYNGYRWLDPGEKAVRDHSTAVILDVVRRYDIDGVHLDDYFYPYPAKNASGQPVDFPDEPAWTKYRAAKGKLSRKDWRRKNIDDFVQTLYQRIKAEKPFVKFGISPFGIWRPGHPPSIQGLDAYEFLYADARKWLNHGWLDYIVPQLYWSIARPEQSYPALLEWWTQQNPRQRHIWAGNYAARLDAATSPGEKPWLRKEIGDQIELTRGQSGATGNVLYNMGILMRNTSGISDLLSREIYSQPVLPPAFPWLDSQPPGKAAVTVSGISPKELRAVWQPGGREPAAQWLVQTRVGGQWRHEILAGAERSRSWTGLTNWPALIAITAVDRCGNTSSTSIVDLSHP